MAAQLQRHARPRTACAEEKTLSDAGLYILPGYLSRVPSPFDRCCCGRISRLQSIAAETCTGEVVLNRESCGIGEHMKMHLPKSLCALAMSLLWPMAMAQSHPSSQPRSLSAQESIGALEQQAQEYLHEQKPQLAIPVYRKIISLDPKSLNAHGNLGVLLFFQHDYAGAIPQMRAALQMKSDLWRIRALLGMAEKQTGDATAAQADLGEAFPRLDDIKIKRQAGLELVELDSSSGRFASALSVVEELEKQLPTDPQVIFAAYEISSQMMDQSILNMALAGPNSAEMHMMMAGTLARQGNRTAAIAQYRQAIELNPNLPGAHYELAEQLRTSTDPALNAQAEDEYKTALQVNQYDVKAWLRLGEIVAAHGDYKQAQEDYRKALALEPGDSDAKTDLAIALVSMNQTSEAIPLLESALKDDPTNSAAHYRLSLLYRREGRVQDSRREMDLFLHYKDIKDKLSKIFLNMRTTPGSAR
jgi:tetratricopeptide (TPR) repeat protein